MIRFCSDLLKIEKGISNIIDNHSSGFWNFWWFRKDFTQRLDSCIQQSSKQEIDKVLDCMKSAVDKFANILKNACEQLPENKAFFWQQAFMIALTNQKNCAQAAQQAVDLITTILGNLIAPGLRPGFDMVNVNNVFKLVLKDEQERASKMPSQSMITIYPELLNPNIKIFLNAIFKVRNIMFEQRVAPAIQQAAK